MTPLEVTRRYADAWAAGDAATVVAFYADDIVLHYFGQNPLAGDHVGKAAALTVLGKVSAAAKRAAPVIHDVLGSDTHAAILAQESWMDGDTPITVNRVLVFHVRNDQFSECWVYDEDQRMVDAIFSR